MRYIEVDSIIAKIKAEHCDKCKHDDRCFYCDFDKALLLLEEADDADVVEVKHGAWKEKVDDWDGVYYTCSVCRCDWTTIDGTPQENNMKYCPNCGAKMDEERKGE